MTVPLTNLIAECTQWLLTAVFLEIHNIYCFSAINLICFLWPQTWFLYFLISYQLLIKPLPYAQAFIFKTFHIFSLVLTSFSHENIIETSLTSKNCHLAKFCKVMRKVRRFISREKQAFLGDFSLAFPRFPQISKNRLNTSLLLLGILGNMCITVVC